MLRTALALLLTATVFGPAFGQELSSTGDLKSMVLKHLKTSEEFTLKVAEAMPESDYDFKLTPDQMTFGGQITHLTQAVLHYLAPLSTEKPAASKPVSAKKADVIAFVKTSFDAAEADVSKLTIDDMSKSYKMGNRPMSGMELILGMFVHTAHHRSAAEMYLRAKGVTPPPYQF
ncbi:MAG: DinB family protein [Bryobacteraceae bacterium]